MTKIVGEELGEAVAILPYERVLDVACGSGNGTLVAARRDWGQHGGIGREDGPACELDPEAHVGLASMP